MTYGYVDEAFTGVGALFEQLAAEPQADGVPFESQLAVYVGGQMVVDVASVIAPDALMTVHSSSKGAAGFTAALLVERGLVDLDERVSTYWPEFAAEGKADVTVRQVLTHQAGLPQVDGGMPPSYWMHDHLAAERLALQKPLWRPGMAFGYHGLSLGALLSEICFRVTGLTVQQYYEANIRGPKGFDFYLGLPTAEEPRVVEIGPMRPPTDAQLAESAALLGPVGAIGPFAAAGLDEQHEYSIESPRGRAFGLASASGVASARGLATLYQATAGFGGASGATGSALLGPDILAEFAQVQVAGYDVVLDRHRSHGVVFQKPTPLQLFGSYRAYGHDGYGGSLGFGDPIGEIAFGYTVRTVPFPGGGDRRALALARAVRDAIA